MTVDKTAPELSLAIASPTSSVRPRARVALTDAHGIPDGTTVTYDVDLNNDNDFIDTGETGYTSGTTTQGAVSVLLPTLSVPTTVRVRARADDRAGNQGTSNTVTVNRHAKVGFFRAFGEFCTSRQ